MFKCSDKEKKLSPPHFESSSNFLMQLNNLHSFLTSLNFECRFPCIVILHLHDIVGLVKLWAIVSILHVIDLYV